MDDSTKCVKFCVEVDIFYKNSDVGLQFVLKRYNPTTFNHHFEGKSFYTVFTSNKTKRSKLGSNSPKNLFQIFEIS